MTTRYFSFLPVLALAGCGGMAPSPVVPPSHPGGGVEAEAAEMSSSDSAQAYAGPARAPAPPAGRTAQNAAAGPGGDAAAHAGETGVDAEPDATSDVSDAAPPMLVYTARLHLAVYEAAKTLDSVEELALAKGGYLLSRTETVARIRVPARRFRAFLEAVEALGDVTHRQVDAKDITERFFDLQTRLKNARAVRNRLEALLDKATDVNGALRVEQELSRVTGEIERLEGIMKRLRELVAFSTVTVSLAERPTESVDPDAFDLPFEWLGDLGLNPLLDLGDDE